MAIRSTEYLQSLVKELSKYPDETEWIEFKCNYNNPQMIGEYVSALSNSAALTGKPKGYLVWGINNESHSIEGTVFQYKKVKKGNEELESWLAHMLTPSVNFMFFEILMDGVTVVVLEIPCADKQPVSFAGAEYIRIGTTKRSLKKFPEKERELWRVFDSVPYEMRNAASNLNEEEVVAQLDYPKYYDKLALPLPRNIEQVFEDFRNEKFLRRGDAGKWDVTIMGALLLAKDLRKFDNLSRKPIRVIWYKENNRIGAIREREFTAGYVCAYEEIVQYIMTIISQEEVIEGGIRKTITAFPEIAIREMLANQMIHQAIEQRGTTMMVEVFTGRIEFSNAGAPLVAIERIVDTVPVTRNENVAGFMHKCGICEERGSGYDKIVTATSENKLPAPQIVNQDNQFTKVILFAKVPFELMTKEDKLRTCYMRACLAYVNHQAISNADVRDLFGLTESEIAKASRIIKETIGGGLIKPVDTSAAPRYMKYVPFWV